jgi:hypothetical protein
LRIHTHGYSDQDLIALNAEYEVEVYLPADALAAMTDWERRSWEDRCAEQVLADFDDFRAFEDPGA